MSKKDFFEAKNTKELCQLLGVSEKEAAKIEIRRNLVIKIKRVIEKNKWTHEEASEEAGVGRTVITAIVNGNLEKISTDRLIDIAHNFGLKITLKVA
jgi:predicted XRE-type DNA-binding protein